MYRPKNVITTRDEIRQILGDILPTQEEKVIDHIDPMCRAWIERSPFCVLASRNQTGQMDAAPKGDPPGFVRVLDNKTLVVPDRRGNNRGDSLMNIVESPEVALIFFVPKRRETVRVNGRAVVACDPELLEQMVEQGKSPNFAIVVTVEEAYFHCGKAPLRAGLWKPESWGSIEGLPTYAEALKAHGDLDYPLEMIEEGTRRNEEEDLY